MPRLSRTSTSILLDGKPGGGLRVIRKDGRDQLPRTACCVVDPRFQNFESWCLALLHDCLFVFGDPDRGTAFESEWSAMFSRVVSE